GPVGGQKEGDLALVGAQLERDLDLDRPAVRRRLRPGFVAEGEDLVEDQPDGRQHEGAGDGEETWRHGAIFPRGSAPDPERKMKISLKIRPAFSPLDRQAGAAFVLRVGVDPSPRGTRARRRAAAARSVGPPARRLRLCARTLHQVRRTRGGGSWGTWSFLQV